MKDIIDVLLDGNNTEPIVLMNENGKQITFKQVAVIPYTVDDDERLYAILKPDDHIDGIGDNEAIAFYVDADDEGNSVLRVEENEEAARAVFDIFYKMVEDASEKD